MLDLKRKLMAVTIGCLLSVGIVGQKQDNPRPPKDRNKVVVTPKEPRPPQTIILSNPEGTTKRESPKAFAQRFRPAEAVLPDAEYPALLKFHENPRN